MEILNQNEEIIIGKGKIHYPHYAVDVQFQIEYSPYRLFLKTSKIVLGQSFAIGYGRFEGLTSTQKEIRCSKICLSRYSKYQMTFVLLEDLIIGSDSDHDIFSARLFGLQESINEFRLKEVLISTRAVDNINEILLFSEKYGYFLESSILEIKAANFQPLNKDTTLELSQVICLLLSLICAQNIVYNRFEFISRKTNDSLTKIHINLILNSYGNRFIFEQNLDEVIPIFYENFEKLNHLEKKCFYTAITYLNSLANNYLEDSILNIAQVWEIFADAFLRNKVENKDSIAQLRGNLKAAIREWHKSNEIADYDFGFISERVLASLDWEKVIRKLENLALQENLNSEVIGLNFKDLIELRNQITHTGRFTEVGNENRYLDIFNSSLLGIKVLILSKLGFAGNLTFFAGGIPITKNIRFYLK